MHPFRQTASQLALVGMCTLTLVAGCTDQSVAPASDARPAPAARLTGTKGPATPLITALVPTFVQYSSPISLAVGARLVGSAGGTFSIGPFSLTIPSGAVLLPLTLTVASTNVLFEQCSIEPTGTLFLKPVTLTYSYAGTSADPASPNYLPGGVLTGEWFDPSSSLWTPIGGTDNSTAKTFSVSLKHLSYYALAK